jgi:hypothetical protein
LTHPGDEALSKLGTLKSQHALAVRYHGADSPQARDTGKKLAEERTTARIAQLLAEATPLTDEQRAKLAELLQPARGAINAARLAELGAEQLGCAAS